MSLRNNSDGILLAEKKHHNVQRYKCRNKPPCMKHDEHILGRSQRISECRACRSIYVVLRSCQDADRTEQIDRDCNLSPAGRGCGCGSTCTGVRDDRAATRGRTSAAAASCNASMATCALCMAHCRSAQWQIEQPAVTARRQERPSPNFHHWPWVPPVSRRWIYRRARPR